MSGIKRKIEDNDPDYEDISLVQESKRNKVVEHNGKIQLLAELGLVLHVRPLECRVCIVASTILV